MQKSVDKKEQFVAGNRQLVAWSFALGDGGADYYFSGHRTGDIRKHVRHIRLPAQALIQIQGFFLTDEDERDIPAGQHLGRNGREGATSAKRTPRTVLK